MDDDEPVRRVLGVGLRASGFVVWLAADGREAVDLYRCHRPAIDVVLLDVQKPGRDGPGTLAALRELDPGVRFCFMSGDTGAWSEHALFHLGAVALFRKPFAVAGVARQLHWAARDGDADQQVQSPRWGG